jgi:hypothetical protein
MTVSEQLEKTLKDRTPLYAVVGAGDFAVARLREAQAELQQRVGGVTLDPKAVQGKVQMTAQERMEAMSTRARSAYADFAERGKVVVERIRSQQSTQDLAEHAEATAHQAQTAESTVEQAAEISARSVRRTAETARDTAALAKDALREAADQIGQPDEKAD